MIALRWLNIFTGRQVLILRTSLLLVLMVLITGCVIERQSEQFPSDDTTTVQEDQVSGEHRVSLEIAEGPQGQVLALIPVYINDQGPYNFALDTGASNSAIDQQLSEELNLPVQGPAGGVTGIGGTAEAQLVDVESWRLGENLSLGSSTIVTIDMPRPDRGHGIQGLLGSDVLSTFGTITIDYDSGVLDLRPQAEESATPTPQ